MSPVKQMMPRNPARQSQQGFTLIEIMVVVVIIGVMLTAVVALRGGGQQHRYLLAEAQRVNHLLTVAQQQAIQQGLPARLVFNDKGYAFEFWQLIETEQNTLLPGEEPDFSLKGEWQLPEQGNLRDYQPEWPMTFKVELLSKDKALMIYPDGLLTPAKIRISLEDWEQDALLTTDGFSALAIELVDQGDD
ncbi:prepilin-type N-terminal cleavage/methylation domain-containing protein [Oceanospirillum beijerinckii]|uniref:prepilin-type N-terminal cleavage/methylation domain-containing protein n=1 Tax=Oceanospirillum beijerinckii TaxID=64976 RepID=UPI000483A77D|nr:prepilin-type N-terminal cleavage/methylation domain-containing protein [Oceanospirillum beijerinckii]